MVIESFEHMLEDAIHMYLRIYYHTILLSHTFQFREKWSIENQLMMVLSTIIDGLRWYPDGMTHSD